MKALSLPTRLSTLPLVVYLRSIHSIHTHTRTQNRMYMIFCHRMNRGSDLHLVLPQHNPHTECRHRGPPCASVSTLCLSTNLTSLSSTSAAAAVDFCFCSPPSDVPFIPVMLGQNRRPLPSLRREARTSASVPTDGPTEANGAPCIRQHRNRHR